MLPARRVSHKAVLPPSALLMQGHLRFLPGPPNPTCPAPTFGVVVSFLYLRGHRVRQASLEVSDLKLP